MDFETYRNTSAEFARIEDLMGLVPTGLKNVLDVGARDGFISKKLAKKCDSVVALDLEMPAIEGANITCVKGNAASMPFKDATFDLVLCAEVLEHIPPNILTGVCREIARVSNTYLLLGVPYRQDTRWGRTTCYSCGVKNPPWGHVNEFDKERLVELFPEFHLERFTFVGETRSKTNAFSTLLMDWAGNPYGTYTQDEQCVACGAALIAPPPRSAVQKVLTRLAFYGNRLQQVFLRPQPNWIHVVFRRR
jgi:hypothetical protein